MKRYFFDGETQIRAYDVSTGDITCAYRKGHPEDTGKILFIGIAPISEAILKAELQESRTIPTELLIEVLQSYPAWTLFDVSLQLQGCRASHTLQWNGKFSLRDMSHVDGTTRMVRIKNFYPNEGFWVINDISTPEDMNA